MTPRATWVFQVEPVTLGHLLRMKQIGQGDLQALVDLIVAHAVPETTMHEVLAIESAAIPDILAALNAAVVAGSNYAGLVARQGLQ